jgi:hypothetical protein
VLVLGCACDISEHKVGLETAFLSLRVKGKGIIVNDSKVVGPGETLHILIQVGSQGVSEILLAELVGSRHIF